VYVINDCALGDKLGSAVSCLCKAEQLVTEAFIFTRDAMASALQRPTLAQAYSGLIALGCGMFIRCE